MLFELVLSRNETFASQNSKPKNRVYRQPKTGFRFWKNSGLPDFSVSVKTGLETVLTTTTLPYQRTFTAASQLNGNRQSSIKVADAEAPDFGQTSTNDLPAWFLRLGSAVFALPWLSCLTSQLQKVWYLDSGRHQWLLLYLRFTNRLTQVTLDRSVTPIVSLPSQRCLVRIYKTALHLPAAALNFSDQFAFRPSGSTTAALVALFHTQPAWERVVKRKKEREKYWHSLVLQEQVNLV